MRSIDFESKFWDVLVEGAEVYGFHFAGHSYLMIGQEEPNAQFVPTTVAELLPLGLFVPISGRQLLTMPELIDHIERKIDSKLKIDSVATI